MSHEGLDPETGAKKSVPLYDWTRPGTDDFLGHAECQGADWSRDTEPVELLIQMGDWCGSDGGSIAVVDSFTGPSTHSDTANPPKIPGARRGIAGYNSTPPEGSDQSEPYGVVCPNQLPIDGGLLMGDTF